MSTNLDTSDILRTLAPLMDPPIRYTGHPTGFPDLDAILKGLQPGQLTLIASRPGMGATTLAMNIITHLLHLDADPHILVNNLLHFLATPANSAGNHPLLESVPIFLNLWITILLSASAFISEISGQTPPLLGAAMGS